MSQNHEFVEVVDTSNRVLALMPRDQVHRQQLLHRAVLILVFSPGNKLVLQRRSRSKKLYAGRWDLSATGHVKPGESRERAALREVWEELGVSLRRLRLLHELAGGPETGNEFVSLFTAGVVTDDLRPDPAEVEELCAVDSEELETLIRSVPELLTPALHYYWKRDLLFPPLLTGR